MAPESDAAEVKKPAGASKKVAASTTLILNDGLPMQISIEELEAIMVHPTNSVAERSTILDARDRYIRLKTEAKTTTVKSAIIKGTCHDMCPEKERYSRAEKRRLEPYEITAGCDKVFKKKKTIKKKINVKINIKKKLLGFRSGSSTSCERIFKKLG